MAQGDTMWAVRRRVRIVSGIVAAILIFVIFPYWYTHRVPPTCTDGKQNQEELGVDCGGPCTLRCKGMVRDLNVLWTKVFMIRPSYYDVVAYVENPNPDSGVSNLSYVAKLFDEGGQEIAKSTRTGYVRPNERFVLFVGGMDTGGAVARSASIEFPSGMRWDSMLPSPVLFSVRDRALSNLERRPILSATLENTTPNTHEFIDVASIIYDDKSNPIAASMTRVDRMEPSASANLIFTWPAPFDYVAGSEQCVTPVDVILAVDRSGSMNFESKLEQARAAASSFVDRLTVRDQGGYVTFATDASSPIDQMLTGDSERLKRAITRTDIASGGTQFTNIGDAIRRAIDEFATQRRNIDARPILILMTDGIPNRPLDEAGRGTEAYGSAYAERIATEAKEKGVTIYTIGLGSDVNQGLLERLATEPDHYYFAASGSELTGVYQQIATAMCKKAPSIIEIIPRVNNVVPAITTR